MIPDNVATFKGESAQIYPAVIAGAVQQVNVCRCGDLQWKGTVCLSCQTLLSLIPAGSDFNVTVFDFSFVGGGAPEIIAATQFPAIDDTLPELREGFLYYLEVVNSQLHLRDVGRIDFFNRFTLVRIQDNDCEPQLFGPFSLYPYVHPLSNLQDSQLIPREILWSSCVTHIQTFTS